MAKDMSEFAYPGFASEAAYQIAYPVKILEGTEYATVVSTDKPRNHAIVRRPDPHFLLDRQKKGTSSML